MILVKTNLFNNNRIRVWAHSYSTGEWSTEKPQRIALAVQLKMYLQHLDDSSLTCSARIELNNNADAVPIGTQNLVIKFRQEQFRTISGTKQGTNIKDTSTSIRVID